MVDAEPKLFLIQGDVYEVEKLVAVKIVKGKKLFRVRWRGYGRESDTLEPEENLLSCKDMIEDLEQKIADRHERRKNKKGYRSEDSTKDELDIMPDECEISKPSMDSTWQASEVEQSSLFKDTFWRDFDEGKITVSGTVFDKDMYSKVKERAERGTKPSISEPKSGESSPKGSPAPPLCPKVVLKRKSSINRAPSETLTYKSSLQKPISVHIKKRKKYDVLRDYRKRKSRLHRKRKLDENGRRKLNFRNETYTTECGSNILQELLINDDQKAHTSNVDGDVKVKSEEDLEENGGGEGKKALPLVCRISIQDSIVANYPTLKNSPKKEDSAQVKGSILSMGGNTRRAFISLIEAVEADRMDKVERLCSHNNVVNCYQEDGTTALMVAAQLGRYYVSKVLLKANAHKDKQNKIGETALMLACKNGHSKISKLLLEHGANFSLTNVEGINVLRITNKYASQTAIHSILIEHIVRVVSAFEDEARSQVKHVAQIKYALFPIQCFSLNEGPRYNIHFHHHVKLESPEKNGNQNLLFIARATIKGQSTQCQFDTDSLIHSVFINGTKQDLFKENMSSVFKVTGLQNGSNKVCIKTGHYPESEVKLIVCAYKVHRTALCFPAQKVKSDF